MTTKEPKKHTGIRLKVEMAERLDRESGRHEVSKNRIVEKALDEYLKKLEAREAL